MWLVYRVCLTRTVVVVGVSFTNHIVITWSGDVKETRSEPGEGGSFPASVRRHVQENPSLDYYLLAYEHLRPVGTFILFDYPTFFVFETTGQPGF